VAASSTGLNKISVQQWRSISRVELNSISAGGLRRAGSPELAIRTSTGVEFQVLMPVVNALPVYWAYNPTLVQQFLQPRSFRPVAFPNEETFLTRYPVRAIPFFEKSTWRFTSAERSSDMDPSVSFGVSTVHSGVCIALSGLRGRPCARAAGSDKVGIIHIQNAIISTKDGEKIAGELRPASTPPKRIEKRQTEIRRCAPVEGAATP
jgi:hypothetical protein